LDAFALKRYAFTLHHTNSYFTFATILLSAAIVAVSIYLNIQTISHIWLLRSELPVMTSHSFAYPDPLTSTLVCFKSNVIGNATVPNARILDENAN
jgi:hypothetical protein